MRLLGFGAIYVPKTPPAPAAIWGCRGSKSRRNPSWAPKVRYFKDGKKLTLDVRFGVSPSLLDFI